MQHVVISNQTQSGSLNSTVSGPQLSLFSPSPSYIYLFYSILWLLFIYQNPRWVLFADRGCPASHRDRLFPLTLPTQSFRSWPAFFVGGFPLFLFFFSIHFLTCVHIHAITMSSPIRLLFALCSRTPPYPLSRYVRFTIVESVTLRWTLVESIRRPTNRLGAH